MPEETIEVLHSEEGEEISDSPNVETDIEEVVEEEEILPETPEVEVELYDLPDGRKVDGATLAREWKDNFLPDYTRKSQELASMSKPTLPTETKPENPYANPDYVPQTYAEIIEAAKEAALNELALREEQKTAAHQAIENEVIGQLNSVKQLDPNVDENKLFLHANKYGFRDLSTAYQNMKDMGQLTKTVQRQTAENIAKRKDPVSVVPGGQVGGAPDPSGFSSAVDYMRSLTN